MNDLLEALERLLGEAEVLEVEHHVGLVEEAHDDLLAVHGGQRGDAHVDGLAADHEADAAVLRHAPLGDVQLGHDLEAADDARLHAPRDRHDLVQHAVDAEADDELLGLRLEVDVARRVVDRLRDDGVDELDDRRLFGGVADVGDRVFVELADPHRISPTSAFSR